MIQQRTPREKIKLWILIQMLKFYFHTEKHLLKIKHINYPGAPFLLAMQHCHQCLLYGIQDKDKFFALISPSNDGEVIAKAAETLNIKSVRGSSQRFAVAASLELIDKVKAGNSAAIMVDGPKGPKWKVKEGIVNISKLTGVPVIPVAWYSKDKTFLTFNTWDKFNAPLGHCQTVALYGEPIHIPPDITKEQTAQYCQQIEEANRALQKELEENYDKYFNTAS